MSKVLIVDDSIQMLDLMQEMVSLFGHEAETAHSGAEGLEVVKVFQPDLILLDVMMPNMNGWEFLERHKAGSDIPVIMISADTSSATRKKAIAADITLLEKSMDPLALRDIINTRLAGDAQV